MPKTVLPNLPFFVSNKAMPSILTREPFLYETKKLSFYWKKKFRGAMIINIKNRQLPYNHFRSTLLFKLHFKLCWP
jgi:hypothetical protein